MNPETSARPAHPVTPVDVVYPAGLALAAVPIGLVAVTDEDHLLEEIDDAELLAKARQYATGSRAASTWAAYARDWRLFTAWCHDRGVKSRPASPTTVAA